MNALLVVILIAMATITGVWTERFEVTALPQGHGAWVRPVAYWLFTVVVSFELAAGALWDLLRIEYVRVVLAHLGYPLYLLIILGMWRIPGALALLAPRLPRLKEWAYAGVFFEFTGAAASHFLAGDHAGQWAPPLILSIFTLVSWALRPAARRLAGLTPPAKMRLTSWAVPVFTVAAMLAVALFTLPKGTPPQ